MKVQELISELQKFRPAPKSRFTQENAARSNRYIKSIFIPAARSSRASFWWMKPSNLASQDDATAPSAPLVWICPDGRLLV